MTITQIAKGDEDYALKIEGVASAQDAADYLEMLKSGDVQIDEIAPEEAANIVGAVTSSPSIIIWVIYGSAMRAILRAFGVIIP